MRHLSRWGQACIAALAIILVMRTIYLDADPPTGLSVSSDVHTDPAQYTHYARNYVLTGEANPFNDDRFAVFMKSSVNMLAIGVFKLFGVGLWQSNTVAVFYSFGALLCLFLVLRRIAGNAAGFVFLITAGVNYNLTFYGRVPFLEHAVAFWGFLALALITCSASGWAFALAGIALGASIFFSKIFGVVFLFPFAVWFVYRYFYESREKLFRNAACLIGGLGMMALFWYFYLYLPMQSQVSSYFTEQSLSLYGAPDGLKSVDDFIFKMVTFGDGSELYNRMPITALLALAAMGMLAWRISFKQSWKKGFSEWTSGHLFLVAMTIAFYGSLMIWNYRPLRYQIILIYPTYALAAIVLVRMFTKAALKSEPAKTEAPPVSTAFPWLYYVLLFPLMLILAYKAHAWFSAMSGSETVWSDDRVWIYMLAILLTALVGGAIYTLRAGILQVQNSLLQICAVVMIAGMVLHGLFNFGYWVTRPSYSTVDNARDLAEILNPGAVISGPYGPGFSLSSNIPSVIHMFGVAKIDTWLFRKYPITHLLLDESNEESARKNYPEIMSEAHHFRTFFIGNRKVRLFRIAGATDNPIADSYRRSDLEEAVIGFLEGSDSGNEPALRFATAHPRNVSSVLLMGERAEVLGMYDVAESMFQKAIEFSSTNANLYVRAGTFCKDRWVENGDPAMKEKARKFLERASHFAPGTLSITRSLAELNQPRESLKKSNEQDER
ncbi:MAG: hypothetical protein AAB305_04855 [Candidatus Zixiibacteriota bacterium]